MGIQKIDIGKDERLSQLQEENTVLKNRLQATEQIAYETSATTQGLLELLIDMEVI